MATVTNRFLALDQLTSVSILSSSLDSIAKSIANGQKSSIKELEEYVEKSPKCHELFSVWQKIDQWFANTNTVNDPKIDPKDVSNVLAHCMARLLWIIGTILQKSDEYEKKYFRTAGLKQHIATKCIGSSYLKSFYSWFGSRRWEPESAVLRLLTIISESGSSFVLSLIRNFNFSFAGFLNLSDSRKGGKQSSKKESAPPKEDASKRAPSVSHDEVRDLYFSSDDVRGWFIRFVLSLLRTGEASITAQVVAIKGLLGKALLGLADDPPARAEALLRVVYHEVLKVEDIPLNRRAGFLSGACLGPSSALLAANLSLLSHNSALLVAAQFPLQGGMPARLAIPSSTAGKVVALGRDRIDEDLLEIDEAQEGIALNEDEALLQSVLEALEDEEKVTDTDMALLSHARRVATFLHAACADLPLLGSPNSPVVTRDLVNLARLASGFGAPWAAPVVRLLQRVAERHPHVSGLLLPRALRSSNLNAPFSETPQIIDGTSTIVASHAFLQHVNLAVNSLAPHGKQRVTAEVGAALQMLKDETISQAAEAPHFGASNDRGGKRTILPPTTATQVVDAAAGASSVPPHELPLLFQRTLQALAVPVSSLTRAGLWSAFGAQDRRVLAAALGLVAVTADKASAVLECFANRPELQSVGGAEERAALLNRLRSLVLEKLPDWSTMVGLRSRIASLQLAEDDASANGILVSSAAQTAAPTPATTAAADAAAAAVAAPAAAAAKPATIDEDDLEVHYGVDDSDDEEESMDEEDGVEGKRVRENDEEDGGRSAKKVKKTISVVTSADNLHVLWRSLKSSLVQVGLLAKETAAAESSTSTVEGIDRVGLYELWCRATLALSKLAPAEASRVDWAKLFFGGVGASAPSAEEKTTAVTETAAPTAASGEPPKKLSRAQAKAAAAEARANGATPAANSNAGKKAPAAVASTTLYLSPVSRILELRIAESAMASIVDSDDSSAAALVSRKMSRAQQAWLQHTASLWAAASDASEQAEGRASLLRVVEASGLARASKVQLKGLLVDGAPLPEATLWRIASEGRLLGGPALLLALLLITGSQPLVFAAEGCEGPDSSNGRLSMLSAALMKQISFESFTRGFTIPQLSISEGAKDKAVTFEPRVAAEVSGVILGLTALLSPAVAGRVNYLLSARGEWRDVTKAPKDNKTGQANVTPESDSINKEIRAPLALLVKKLAEEATAVADCAASVLAGDRKARMASLALLPVLVLLASSPSSSVKKALVVEKPLRAAVDTLVPSITALLREASESADAMALRESLLETLLCVALPALLLAPSESLEGEIKDEAVLALFGLIAQLAQANGKLSAACSLNVLRGAVVAASLSTTLKKVSAEVQVEVSGLITLLLAKGAWTTAQPIVTAAECGTLFTLAAGVFDSKESAATLAASGLIRSVVHLVVSQFRSAPVDGAAVLTAALTLFGEKTELTLALVEASSDLLSSEERSVIAPLLPLLVRAITVALAAEDASAADLSGRLWSVLGRVLSFHGGALTRCSAAAGSVAAIESNLSSALGSSLNALLTASPAVRTAVSAQIRALFPDAGIEGAATAGKTSNEIADGVLLALSLTGQPIAALCRPETPAVAALFAPFTAPGKALQNLTGLDLAAHLKAIGGLSADVVASVAVSATSAPESIATAEDRAEEQLSYLRARPTGLLCDSTDLFSVDAALLEALEACDGLGVELDLMQGEGGDVTDTNVAVLDRMAVSVALIRTVTKAVAALKPFGDRDVFFSLRLSSVASVIAAKAQDESISSAAALVLLRVAAGVALSAVRLTRDRASSLCAWKVCHQILNAHVELGLVKKQPLEAGRFLLSLPITADASLELFASVGEKVLSALGKSLKRQQKALKELLKQSKGEDEEEHDEVLPRQLVFFSTLALTGGLTARAVAVRGLLDAQAPSESPLLLTEKAHQKIFSEGANAAAEEPIAEGRDVLEKYLAEEWVGQLVEELANLADKDLNEDFVAVTRRALNDAIFGLLSVGGAIPGDHNNYVHQRKLVPLKAPRAKDGEDKNKEEDEEDDGSSSDSSSDSDSSSSEDEAPLVKGAAGLPEKWIQLLAAGYTGSLSVADRQLKSTLIALASRTPLAGCDLVTFASPLELPISEQKRSGKTTQTNDAVESFVLAGLMSQVTGDVEMKGGDDSSSDSSSDSDSDSSSGSDSNSSSDSESSSDSDSDEEMPLIRAPVATKKTPAPSAAARRRKKDKLANLLLPRCALIPPAAAEARLNTLSWSHRLPLLAESTAQATAVVNGDAMRWLSLDEKRLQATLKQFNSGAPLAEGFALQPSDCQATRLLETWAAMDSSLPVPVSALAAVQVKAEKTFRAEAAAALDPGYVIPMLAGRLALALVFIRGTPVAPRTVADDIFEAYYKAREEAIKAKQEAEGAAAAEAAASEELLIAEDDETGETLKTAAEAAADAGIKTTTKSKVKGVYISHKEWTRRRLDRSIAKATAAISKEARAEADALRGSSSAHGWWLQSLASSEGRDAFVERLARGGSLAILLMGATSTDSNVRRAALAGLAAASTILQGSESAARAAHASLPVKVRADVELKNAALRFAFKELPFVNALLNAVKNSLPAPEMVTLTYNGGEALQEQASLKYVGKSGSALAPEVPALPTSLGAWAVSTLGIALEASHPLFRPLTKFMLGRPALDARGLPLWDSWVVGERPATLKIERSFVTQVVAVAARAAAGRTSIAQPDDEEGPTGIVSVGDIVTRVKADAALLTVLASLLATGRHASNTPLVSRSATGQASLSAAASVGVDLHSVQQIGELLEVFNALVSRPGEGLTAPLAGKGRGELQASLSRRLLREGALPTLLLHIAHATSTADSAMVVGGSSAAETAAMAASLAGSRVRVGLLRSLARLLASLLSSATDGGVSGCREVSLAVTQTCLAAIHAIARQTAADVALSKAFVDSDAETADAAWAQNVRLDLAAALASCARLLKSGKMVVEVAADSSVARDFRLVAECLSALEVQEE